MATKCLQKALQNFNENKYENISAGPINEDNLFYWEATIIGPDDSPYENGIYKIIMNFPSEYPFKPPTCIFITKIFHPNISIKGFISLNILRDQWSPGLGTTIEKILFSISSLLTDPNPEQPINIESAELYKKNKYEYYKKAREWSIKYANAPINNHYFYYLNEQDRINYELNIIKYNENFKLIKNKNLNNCKVIIKAPKGSPYKNDDFELFFNFPKDYPWKPPIFKFTLKDNKSKYLRKYLDHIENICNLIIKEKWNRKVLLKNILNLISKYFEYNFIYNMSNREEELLEKINTLEELLEKEKRKNKDLLEKCEKLSKELKEKEDKLNNLILNNNKFVEIEELNKKSKEDDIKNINTNNLEKEKFSEKDKEIKI